MSPPPSRGRTRSVVLLRGARDRRRPRRTEEEETNDDGQTVLPLRPFGLRLSGLPPASPVWALADVDAGSGEADGGGGRGHVTHSTTDAAMENLLGYISDLGARAFDESQVVGERFREWDLGTVWSVGIGGGDSSGDADDGGDATSPSNRALATPGGAEVAQSSDPSGGTAASAGAAVAGSAELTLGRNGTVTLWGVYWEDDPDPEEITEFLVQEMNEDENREGLLEKLRPIVCDAGDLIGNTCNVEVEVVSSDIPAAGVGEVEEEGDAQDLTTGDNDASESETPDDESDGGEVMVDGNLRPNSTIPGDDVEAQPVSPVGDFIDTSTNTLVGIPSDSEYSGSIDSSRSASNGVGNGKETPLQLILPILILALVAFLFVGLLYRRRRRRRGAMAREDALNAAAEDEEKTAADEPMSESFASDAYDTIAGTSPKHSSRHRGHSSAANSVAGPKGRGDSSTAAATAGNSVAARSRAAAAAGAPQASRRALDDVLDTISDAGSSFVSDSTASASTTWGDVSAPHGSLLSGLTSILGNSHDRGSPTPSEDGEFNDRIMATSAGNQLEGGVGDARNTAAPVTRSVQKQEDFEETYRNRSAMAKLGLKKDILHVADDTHDAAAGANYASEIDFSNANDKALGKSFGVTRTISPKKSVDIMELQRTAEQRLSGTQTMRQYLGGITKGIERSPKKRGGPKKKGKNEVIVKEQRRKEDMPDTSKDLMLPVGFKRSDSVELVSRSSSDMDSEDEVAGAYV